MNMRILVTGAAGQVGRAVLDLARRRGIEAQAMAHANLDIDDAAAVRAALLPGIDAVINAAAFTNVDAAEGDILGCYRTNRDGAANLAAACRDVGAVLVQLSSDYVFNGAATQPYGEDEDIDPLGVYGASKAEAETAIEKLCERHLILRTSWVFAGQGRNFVATMLRLAAGDRPVRVVDDQLGCPTPANDIAAAILTMLDRAVKPGFADFGTYHYCGRPATSWHGFASEIFALLPRPPVLEAIKTSDYPTAAVRPAYSVLNCARIQKKFDLVQPDWRAALPATVAALRETMTMEAKA